MDGKNKWLEEAFDVQLEVLPESDELSISRTRIISPGKAFVMAGFIHKHLIENVGTCPEYKNILKEVEKFGDDKIKVVGFFYEIMAITEDGGEIRVDQLKEVANGWFLGNKFDKLVETLFTNRPIGALQIEN